MENIYLIGYMGTGKSTIGHALTEFLRTKAAGCDNLMYCDTDFIIEVEQRKKIAEIDRRNSKTADEYVTGTSYLIKQAL